MSKHIAAGNSPDPSSISAMQQRCEDAGVILRAAETDSGAMGSEGDRRGISRSPIHDNTVTSIPTCTEGRDGVVPASAAASASAPVVVGQNDFNTLSGLRLREAMPSDSVICLRDNKEAVPSVCPGDSPDADTASSAPSESRPEAVFDPDAPALAADHPPDDIFSNSVVPKRNDRLAIIADLLWGGQAADIALLNASAASAEVVQLHQLTLLHSATGEQYSPDPRLADIQRRLDLYDIFLRMLVPTSPAQANAIQERLAKVACERAAVDEQSQQLFALVHPQSQLPDSHSPPPYDPDWRAGLDPQPSSAIEPVAPIGCTSNTTHAQPLPSSPSYCTNFKHDIRIYTSPKAARAYRQAHNEDFRRYRKEHGCPSLGDRIFNWWCGSHSQA
ncbi:hypothetical protein CALVIDRAFT_561070 [Calocera viscosa TUFC12733]|uniref:Uncharacterized protein n=1 Tax=Calocera viscosa (strain TUFC12733) TaxID=1330018 RepID=A0A167QGP5_CALVF|nr:hypothetical protein CALVIDRAFT_561070 [Calocera viscosa TUFC12733]